MPPNLIATAHACKPPRPANHPTHTVFRVTQLAFFDLNQGKWHAGRPILTTVIELQWQSN
jgi:hypothetical protein